MLCSLDEQKYGLISVISTIVTIAGLLTVVSLSVVLMQIKSESNECHLCGDHVSRGKKLGEMIIILRIILRWPRRAMSITNFNIYNYQF